MYVRSLDPVNWCTDDPESQPFQLSIPVKVIDDGFPALVTRGIGIEDNNNSKLYTTFCIVEVNVIHVAYDRNDLLHYDTKGYINGIHHRGGDLSDIVLREAESIRIEFTTRN